MSTILQRMEVVERSWLKHAVYSETGRGWSRTEGTIETQDGTVYVFANTRIAVYRLVIRGVGYTVTERRGRTRRGLLTMASKVARALVAQVGAHE